MPPSTRQCDQRASGRYKQTREDDARMRECDEISISVTSVEMISLSSPRVPRDLRVKFLFCLHAPQARHAISLCAL
jgi:hypothetical protein